MYQSSIFIYNLFSNRGTIAAFHEAKLPARICLRASRTNHK